MWKRQRSTMSPTFSSSKMKEIFPILQKCIETEIERLHRIVAGEKEGVIAAKDEFGNISMNSLIQVCYNLCEFLIVSSTGWAAGLLI